MKTKSVTHGLKPLLAIALLITFSGICKAQSDVQGQLQENACILKSFTVKQVEQKNYLNWNIESTLTDFYFLIEKSTDDKEFSTVTIKKGGASPTNHALLFSFIDETDNSPRTVYRISAYVLHFPDKDTQIINSNEKNILTESPNSIIEVKNNFTALLQVSDFNIKY